MLKNNYDVLYNFISPVTGRILSDPDYTLLGNSLGIAIPSPILIDMRLDLINLRKDYNTATSADFIIGNANSELSNAQVLHDMPDGYLYNTVGVVSTISAIPINHINFSARYNLITGGPEVAGVFPAIEVDKINISNFADLTSGKIWIGNELNRPVEISPPVGPKGDDGDRGPAGNSGLKIIAALAGMVGLRGRTGSGGNAGAAGNSGATTIYVHSNFDMLGNRISNIAQSPGGDFDAISTKFLWDLLHDNVNIKWQD